MKHIKRIINYHWRSLVATEILLLLLYTLLLNLILPIMSRQNNTVRILDDLGTNNIYLLHGKSLAPLTTQHIFLSNGNIFVKDSDEYFNCNVFLLEGATKHAYVDKFLLDRIEQQYIEILIDGDFEEISASPIIPFWVPFFHNYEPIIILTGYNEYIERYDLSFIGHGTSDLSKFTIVDSFNLSEIKFETSKVFFIWCLFFFVLYYLVRRTFPAHGKIKLLELYRYLFRLGVSRRLIYIDSFFFSVLANVCWILVLIVHLEYYTVCTVVLCILFKAVLIPLIVENLLIWEGFRK